MSTITYELFFRNYGVRRLDQLQRPPLPLIAQLDLPRESVLHYISDSRLDIAPKANDPLFKMIHKPVLVGHVYTLISHEGKPMKAGMNIEADISKYHADGRNRRFRRMRDYESAQRDPTSLIVFNYGFSNEAYKYPRSLYSEYFRWKNEQIMAWKNIRETAKAESTRHHFIRALVPKVLPSLTELKLGMGTEPTQRMLKIFDNHESLFILELWKWFGPHRETSLMKDLTAEEARKINIVFIQAGRWTMINMGLLNDWRIATKEELTANPEANKKGMDALQLQLRFLRMLMAVFEERTETSEVEVTGKPLDKVAPLLKPVMNRDTGKIEMVDQNASASMPKTSDAEKPTQSAADIKIEAGADESLMAELNKLELVSRDRQELADPANIPDLIPLVANETPEEGMKVVAERLAAAGSISGPELARYNRLAEAYKTIVAPDGATTMEHFIKVKPEDVAIPESHTLPDIPTVFDKSMLKSSLHTFDAKYTKHVMQKDIAGAVMNIQHAGIAVTSYEVEDVEDIVGAYRDYTIKLTPIEGASSTLRFKLPSVDDEGVYRTNGVNSSLRKQDVDLPIRKVATDKVALTSYYGKTFVTRSDKRVNNHAMWLNNAIMAKGLDDTDLTVQDLQPSNVFDNLFHCPRLYSTLASSFKAFSVAGWSLNFDHTKREELYGKEAMAMYETDGAVIISTGDGLRMKDSHTLRQYVVMGKDEVLYIAEAGVLTPLGTIEALLHLDLTTAPVDFALLKVLSRVIPVGVVLGYEIGFEKLMNLLKVTPRRVPARGRLDLQSDEYALAFADETLIFSRNDKMASLILGGFNEYHKTIRQYSVFEFDRRAVYMNIMDTTGASVRFLREIDLMYQLFIDLITKELLIEMKEPTTFRGLLVRSVEMLLLDTHPDENDAAFMRKRGYERMAGAVYSNLVQSIRSHNGRPGKAKAAIELHPYAVWQSIAQDTSVSLVSEINPIQNLKDQEAVTTSGTGGRSARSMTKHVRSYHRNAMGVTSESTVDSSDVGINTYTSADPQFTSLRGISRRYVEGEGGTGATALLSTSALLSVGADTDDPKRVNFIGIQQSHGIACVGYRQNPVRTGYDGVIAHRTGAMFATSAKQDGKVLSVSDDGIVVEYKDGEKKGIALGRRFGAASGMTIPHTLVSRMKEGQSFKAGAILSYNSGFFEPDVLNPSNVVWKAGVLVKTVLMESAETLEDSSALSERVANQLKTSVTKVRMVKLNFEQKVTNLKKAGEAVQTEDILCTIEDPVTAHQNLFDETSLDTLRILSAMTPLAKTIGVIEHIEVFYHGDKEDMSESLRTLANASDRDLAKTRKASGKTVYTGQVDESFRVDGDPLLLDTLVIKFYITSEVPAGEGDKGVFGNQMKTVFGRIIPGELVSESGVVIDAIFGQKSIDDRIVNSPALMGTTNSLLIVAGKRAVKAYRS